MDIWFDSWLLKLSDKWHGHAWCTRIEDYRYPCSSSKWAFLLKVHFGSVDRWVIFRSKLLGLFFLVLRRLPLPLRHFGLFSAFFQFFKAIKLKVILFDIFKKNSNFILYPYFSTSLIAPSKSKIELFDMTCSTILCIELNISCSNFSLNGSKHKLSKIILINFKIKNRQLERT